MKRLLVLALIFLLLLGAAGGAAWWFLLREPEEAELVAEVEPETATISFAPMTLPLFEKGTVTGQVMMWLEIEVEVGENFDLVERYKPKLHDAFVSELHALYARRFVTEQGYDSDYVKQRLMGIAAETVGQEIVRGLTLTRDTYADGTT